PNIKDVAGPQNAPDVHVRACCKKTKPGLYQPYKPGLRGGCSSPRVAALAIQRFTRAPLTPIR
ncbi:MAG: hypothetical protein ACHP79_04400, partial [Terriglobales bacterium]